MLVNEKRGKRSERDVRRGMRGCVLIGEQKRARGVFCFRNVCLNREKREMIEALGWTKDLEEGSCT